ncbi:unnamed protein product [Rhizophagus irregularis]|nr:unnamed protein product [Rhizophagus irregularis]
MTNNNINNNNNEDKNNTSIIDSISFESDIVNYDSSSFKFNITTSPSLIVNNILSFNNFVTKFFKELMQELYVTLLNIEFEDGDYTTDDKFNIFIDTFLLEYDLDPKNVLEIIISNSQNILCFSSLIGFFYQHGIGCEVNEIKASNIFSNTIKNNHKEILSQFSFDQKNKPISFSNDDIKELNGIIAQYFYSLLLYKNVIFHRIDNYKLHIKNAEKGDDVSQYYIVAKCYRDGIGTDKNLKEATTWIKKYELSKPYFKPYITLYKFLDGADIDVSSIASHTRM